jgi:hypothetical protein
MNSARTVKRLIDPELNADVLIQRFLKIPVNRRDYVGPHEARECMDLCGVVPECHLVPSTSNLYRQ